MKSWRLFLSLISKLWKAFRASTRERQIWIVVWSLHGLVVLFLTATHLLSWETKGRHRPIHIRMAQAAPPLPSPPALAAPPRPNGAPPARPVPAQSKPSSSSKQQSTRRAPATPARPHKPSTASSQRSAPPPPAPVPPPRSVPLQIPEWTARAESASERPFSPTSPLVNAISPEADAPQYGEYLVQMFQDLLDLPEFGEVKARLTIDASGALIACAVTSAKSEKNKQFLQTRLPELAYAPLADFGISAPSMEFHVVFRNRTE